MKIFTIDSEKNIMAHAAKESARAVCVDSNGVVVAHSFTTELQFEKHQAQFPPKFLVELYNDNFAGLPGFDDCKQFNGARFSNRPAAASRIWGLMQRLKPTDAAPIEEHNVAEIGTPVVTISLAEHGTVQEAMSTATPTPVDTALTQAAAATTPPAASGPTKAEVAAQKAEEKRKAKADKERIAKEAKDKKTEEKKKAAELRAAAAVPKVKLTFRDIVKTADPKADPAWEKLNGMQKRFALLNRPEGLGLLEMIAEFGNQMHTERAFLSQGGAVGKAGLTAYYFKGKDGEVRYSFAKPPEAATPPAAPAQQPAPAAETVTVPETASV